jgi:cell division protein FtsL
MRDNRSPNSIQNFGGMREEKPDSAIQNEGYIKKIFFLKKKVVFSIIVTSIVFVGIMLMLFYRNYKIQQNNVDIKNIKSQISSLKNKSDNIEDQIKNIKKYKEIWITSESRRKDFDGIKIADFNQSFKLLTEKYKLFKPTIKISAPEILEKGVYNVQTLSVNLVNCQISFQSLTDRIAIDFINNFFTILPGYVVIEDLSMEKTKKDGYSNQDLIDISTGELKGLTETKVNFYWYFLKRKAQSNL